MSLTAQVYSHLLTYLRAEFQKSTEKWLLTGPLYLVKKGGGQECPDAIFFHAKGSTQRHANMWTHLLPDTHAYTYWRLPGCLSQKRFWVSGLARKVHISDANSEKNSRSIDWVDHNVLTLKLTHWDAFAHLQSTFSIACQWNLMLKVWFQSSKDENVPSIWIVRIHFIASFVYIF